MSYHYKLTCLAEILRYCKSDQILESCYQYQEDVLRQKKYKNIANEYDLKYKFLQSIMLI